MLKKLKIQNFRLFQTLHVDSLNHVNLFVGKNNSGKTSFLEALYLLFGPKQDFEQFSSTFRNPQGHVIDDFENFWTWLCYGRNPDTKVQISASSIDLEHDYLIRLESTANTIKVDYYDHKPDTNSTAEQQTPLETRTIHRISRASLSSIRKEWPTVSVFSTRLRTTEEDTRLFNQIAIKRGGRQRLIELLKKTEPRLQDLQYLQLGTKPFIYADVGLETLIPVSQLGQGFGRLLQIFSEVILSETKILLIDEIENGLSYKAQLDLWQGLAESTHRTDIQIFATTHSYECVQAAHEVYAHDEPHDFTLHRLERRYDDNIHIVTYNPMTLETAMKLEFEVRG